MKKLIALLLACVMCLSLAACGEKEVQSSENTQATSTQSTDATKADETSLPTENTGKIVAAELEKDEYYIFLTEAQIKSNVQVVELTTENWSDYFEDQIIATEVTDDFGEVVEVNHYESGCYLKPRYCGSGIDVAFKYTGNKMVWEDYLFPNGERGTALWGLDFAAKTKTVFDLDGNIIEDTVSYSPDSEYRTASASIRFGKYYGVNVLFADYPCTEVKGKIAVIELPVEVQTELQNTDLEIRVRMDNGDGCELRSYLSKILSDQ